ncbi:MAG: hypothetical protein S4CHLAM2_02230 [Chlamydiales bacterium]|nr:hypothetical protein [Chlamydiales bacterium]
MKLNLIDKAFLLKKTALFGSLDLDLLLTIADRLELVMHKSKEKVFQLDQNAQRMYLIVEGSVLVQNKRGEQLAELHVGDFFGDEALFHEQPRAYDAICIEPAALLALSRPHLLSIIAECPSVALAFLEAYTQNTEFRIR